MFSKVRKEIFWKIMVIVFVFTASTCSLVRASDDWDTYDKSLFAAHQVIRTVDMFQTNDIYDHKEFYEMNPIIDRGVDEFGTKFIPVYFVGMAVAEYLIADALPSKYRKVFLGVGTAVSLGLVYHNNDIGLGLSFKF